MMNLGFGKWKRLTDKRLDLETQRRKLIQRFQGTRHLSLDRERVTDSKEDHEDSSSEQPQTKTSYAQIMAGSPEAPGRIQTCWNPTSSSVCLMTTHPPLPRIFSTLSSILSDLFQIFPVFLFFFFLKLVSVSIFHNLRKCQWPQIALNFNIHSLILHWTASMIEHQSTTSHYLH